MRKIKLTLICLTAFSFPLEYALEALFGISTIFRPYRLAGMALMLLALLTHRKSEKNALSSSVVNAWVIIIVYAFSISFIWKLMQDGFDVEKSINQVILLLFAFGIFLAIIDMHLNLKEIQTVLIWLCLGTAVTTVYANFESGIGQGIVYRQSGLFRNATSLGTSSAIAFVFWLWLFQTTKAAQRVRLASFALLLLSTWGIIMSGTRAAFLEALAGGLLLVIWRQRVWHMRTAVSVASVVIFVYVILSIFGDSLQPILNRFDPEVFGHNPRTAIWMAALQVGLDHAFLGIGPEQYSSFHMSMTGIHFFSAITNPSIFQYNLGTHNTFISMLVEYGLPCLAALLFILIRIYSALFSIARLGSDPSRYAVLLIALLSVKVIEGILRATNTCPEFFIIMSLCVSLVVVNGKAVLKPSQFRDLGKSFARGQIPIQIGNQARSSYLNRDTGELSLSSK